MKETSFPFTFSSQEEKDRLIGVMDNLLEMVDSMTLHDITSDIAEILDGVNDKILVANGVLQGETKQVSEGIPALTAILTSYPTKEPAPEPEIEYNTEPEAPPEETEAEGERRIVTLIQQWQQRKQQQADAPPEEVEPEGERRILTILRHFYHKQPQEPQPQTQEAPKEEIATNGEDKDE